jgi:hypothetical protein
MKISIIGTAGRKEDGAKMSADLFNRMLLKTQEIIEQNVSNPKHLTLVSGGAAYADHIAVRLFLERPKELADHILLHLFLPAPFNTATNKYEGGFKSSGSIANYYHSLFSKKMEYNTMTDITSAIQQGARIEVFKGFYARNIEVGKTDLLIAFTWGVKGVKAGGTKHTFTHSTAPKKIHIGLGELI